MQLKIHFTVSALSLTRKPMLLRVKLWIILAGLFSASGTPAFSQIWQESDGPANIYEISSLAVNSNDAVCAFGFGQSARTTDKGESWQYISFSDLSSRYSAEFVAQNNLFFAAVSSVGVYKSTDDGQTWNLNNNGLTALNFTHITSTTDGRLFVGTQNGIIFESSNGGDSWVQLSSAVPGANWIYSLAANSSGIYAGTFVGLFRSTDNGASWIPPNSGTSVLYAIHTNSSGVIFAGEAGQIIRSTDNGVSWQTVYTPNHDIMAITVDNNNWIYAGINGLGVARSTDGGDHWSSLGLSGLYVGAVAVNSEGFIYAGWSATGVFRTTDGGTDWSQLMSGYIDTNNGMYVVQMGATTNGNVFARCNQGGALYRSTDNGLHWTILNDATSFVVTPNNTILVSYDGSFSLSSDGGDTWSPLKRFSDVADILFADGSALVFVQSLFQSRTLEPGDAFRSTDNGFSWNSVGFNGLKLTTISVDNAGHAYAATTQNVYHSADNGATWSLASTSPSGSVQFFYSSQKSHNAFAAGSDGVFRSTNFGIDWLPHSSGLPHAAIQCFVVDSNQSFYAGTDSGLFRSTNEGDAWIPTGVTHSVNSVDFNDSAYVYASTTGGIFRSVDGAATFSPFNSGLPDQSTSLCISPSGYAFAACDGKVYRTVTSTTTRVSPIAGIIGGPANFGLTQNYPNPFNPTTIINYQLPRNSFVLLEVFDMLGRKVRTLVNEKEYAGTHSVRVNGSNLASGVYFYRLQADRYVDTKKFVLLK